MWIAPKKTEKNAGIRTWNLSSNKSSFDIIMDRDFRKIDWILKPMYIRVTCRYNLESALLL